MKYALIGIGVIIVIGGILFFLNGAGNGGSLGSRGLLGLALADYDGEEKTLASLGAGRELIVANSWAVWCPFCRAELADFAKLQEANPERILVTAINRAESLSKAKGFTDSVGVTERMAFLLDANDSFYRAIGGFSMPETVFIDANSGEILFHKRGPMTFDEMQGHVDRFIKS